MRIGRSTAAALASILVAAAVDGAVASARGADGHAIAVTRTAAEIAEAPAYFVEFTEAGHLAWTDLRPDHQDSIAAYSIAFFDRFLTGTGGDALAAKRSDVTELKAK